MEKTVTEAMNNIIKSVGFTILIVLIIIITIVVVYISVWLIIGVAILSLCYTIYAMLSAKDKLDKNEL